MVGNFSGAYFFVRKKDLPPNGGEFVFQNNFFHEYRQGSTLSGPVAKKFLPDMYYIL